MNTEDIRSRHWTDAEKQAIRSASKVRAAGLDLPEREYKDIPRLTEEQLARLVRPRRARSKVAVSVRLDPQVLDWLRAQGKGHLTRINAKLVAEGHPGLRNVRGRGYAVRVEGQRPTEG